MNGSTPGNGSSSPFKNMGNGVSTNPPMQQKVGPAVGVGAANPDSIPSGGRLPPRDPSNASDKTIAGTAQRKPFKLEGGESVTNPPTELPSGVGNNTATPIVGEPELDHGADQGERKYYGGTDYFRR